MDGLHSVCAILTVVIGSSGAQDVKVVAEDKEVSNPLECLSCAIVSSECAESRAMTKVRGTADDSRLVSTRRLRRGMMNTTGLTDRAKPSQV